MATACRVGWQFPCRRPLERHASGSDARAEDRPGQQPGFACARHRRWSTAFSAAPALPCCRGRRRSQVPARQRCARHRTAAQGNTTSSHSARAAWTRHATCSGRPPPTARPRMSLSVRPADGSDSRIPSPEVLSGELGGATIERRTFREMPAAFRQHRF
jgi:hypothetical protein